MSPRPALLVIGSVLNMYLADPTGASSGSGWPGFVRHCRRPTKLGMWGNVGTSLDFATDVSKPARFTGKVLGCLKDIVWARILVCTLSY